MSLHLAGAIIWDGVSGGHEMIIAGSQWLIVEMHNDQVRVVSGSVLRDFSRNT